MFRTKLQVIEMVCSFVVIILAVNHSNGQLIGKLFKNAIENGRANRFRLGDIINSAEDAGRGIALHADNVIPTPEAFFNLGKNLLVGYPLERTFDTINTFCEYIYVFFLNIFH